MNSDSNIHSKISGLVHKLLNVFGLEIRLVHNLRAAETRLKQERLLDAWRVIAHHRFSCILDIGANEGQFAQMARRLWPEAQIHCFEPLPGVHETLAKRFLHDPKVTSYNIGLSDRPGTQSMHYSAFSPSSSLLNM